MVRANQVLPRSEEHGSFVEKLERAIAMGRLAWPENCTERFEKKTLLKASTLRVFYERTGLNRDSPEMADAVIEAYTLRLEGEIGPESWTPQTELELQCYEELMCTYHRGGPGAPRNSKPGSRVTVPGGVCLIRWGRPTRTFLEGESGH